MHRGIKAKGVVMMRFWEHDLKNNPETCKEKILSMLSQITANKTIKEN